MKGCLKAFLLAIGILVIVALVVTIAVQNIQKDETGEGGNSPDNPKVETKPSVFDGDPGIFASAEIGNNLINYPELEITITNTTDKKISAIKFYSVPLDVYGEEIKGWRTQENLYTDNSIPAGKTTTISYQLIDQSVKTVKLYLYSVYFEDGSEWGDKDAPASKILKEAPTIEVTVVD